MSDAPMNHGDLGDDYTLPKLYNEDEIAAIRREAQAEAWERAAYHLPVTIWDRIVGCECGEKFNDSLVDDIKDAWRNHIEGLSPDPNYRERIVAQARLEEAEWQDSKHHFDAGGKGVRCSCCERIATLRADLARLAAAEAEKEGK